MNDRTEAVRREQKAVIVRMPARTTAVCSCIATLGNCPSNETLEDVPMVISMLLGCVQRSLYCLYAHLCLPNAACHPTLPPWEKDAVLALLSDVMRQHLYPNPGYKSHAAPVRVLPTSCSTAHYSNNALTLLERSPWASTRSQISPSCENALV